MEWKGGILRGGITFHKTKRAYIVQFRHEGKVISKGFSFSKYPTSEDTKRAAEEWHRQKCHENGWILCRWREGDIPNTIEIELSNGGTTVIDAEDFPKVEGLRVFGYTAPGKHVRYARTNGHPQVNYIHNLLVPQFTQVDHINRNGLDNRKCNLREGSGSVNSHNRRKRHDNTSGKTGVSRQIGRGGPGWRALWMENGKRHSRYFADEKHGGSERAFDLAFQLREKKEKDLCIRNGKEPINT